MTGLLLILWLFLMDTRTEDIENKDNYRAALYSMEIDFSRAQHIVPEIQYTMPDLSTISYKYFIQYGKDRFIEIIDPGNEVNSFTATIYQLDYTTRESTLTAIIDHARNYYVTKDSITYSIEESRGTVTYLCNVAVSNARCDSVSFILQSTNVDYKVIFNDTIANLPSIKLFYPDIQYLPYKIIGIGRHKNTMTLEEVIYGKSSIDSLLQLYNYEGYKQITDKDIPPADRQFTIDLIERLKQSMPEKE